MLVKGATVSEVYIGKIRYSRPAQALINGFMRRAGVCCVCN